MKPLVIYHDLCNDGFTAAWIAHNYFGGQCELCPANYGEAPPNMDGRDVYILDFSYPRGVLLEYAALAKSITVLDHHKTAQADLAGLDTQDVKDKLNLHVEFDMSRSGAMMTWDHFYPKPPPRFVEYIQDRDLWTGALPNTKEVAAFMKITPRTIEDWDEVEAAMEADEGFERVIAVGQALLVYQDKFVQQMLVHAYPLEVLGHDVLACPAPADLCSEIPHELAKGRPFGIGVAVGEDGRRWWSLRSSKDGVDVSEIAKVFGGGGHRHAAGCAEPPGLGVVVKAAVSDT